MDIRQNIINELEQLNLYAHQTADKRATTKNNR